MTNRTETTTRKGDEMTSKTIFELAWRVLDDMAERDEDGNVTLRGKAVEISEALNVCGDATMRLAELITEGTEELLDQWHPSVSE
jgi:hypothetical protein